MIGLHLTCDYLMRQMVHAVVASRFHDCSAGLLAAVARRAITGSAEVNAARGMNRHGSRRSCGAGGARGRQAESVTVATRWQKTTFDFAYQSAHASPSGVDRSARDLESRPSSHPAVGAARHSASSVTYCSTRGFDNCHRRVTVGGYGAVAATVTPHATAASIGGSRPIAVVVAGVAARRIVDPAVVIGFSTTVAAAPHAQELSHEAQSQSAARRREPLATGNHGSIAAAVASALGAAPLVIGFDAAARARTLVGESTARANGEKTATAARERQASENRDPTKVEHITFLTVSDHHIPRHAAARM